MTRATRSLASAALILCVTYATPGPAGEGGMAGGHSRKIERLSLDAFQKRVVRFNEKVQVRLIEFEANRRRYEGERAIFEPALVLSYNHVDSQRPNTVEEQRNLGGVPEFSERNNIYGAGLEWFAPTGANVAFRYDVRDLTNNLQGRDDLTFDSPDEAEIVTFIGLELTQPLLKDRGFDATMAAIRLAAGESDLAFQEFRRQMMVILSSSEVAYWNLYYAQEQHQFWQDSEGIARELLADQQARLESGKATKVDVLRAEAAVSERKARKAESWQKRVEASNAAASFFSVSAAEGLLLVASQPPAGAVSGLSFTRSREAAMLANPDLISQEIRLRMDGVRVNYARNQRLPRLDLKASFGYNGLGSSLNSSWNDVSGGTYPVWSVGMEMRIPLGNGKARNDLASARLQRERTALGMRDIRLQVTNAIDNSLEKVRAAVEATQSYADATGVNEEILANELESLDLGKSDTRRVLEAEEDLFGARVTLLQSRVQVQRALLELELFEGSTLSRRDFEIDREHLQDQTRHILDGTRWTEEQYAAFLADFHDSLLEAEDAAKAAGEASEG